MPAKLSDDAKRKKTAYDSKYIMENVVQRKIIFNKAVAEDVEMLEWLDGHENKNQYVKELIREDMRKAGK